MTKFSFSKTTTLPRDKIFSYSIDVENFNKIMPAQFKNIKILKKDKNQILVEEELKFLGISFTVKTRHEVIYPDTHKITILDGLAKDSVFLEHYLVTENGTSIIIDVDFILSWPFKIILPFIKNLVRKNMKRTFEEFIENMSSIVAKN